MSRARKSLIVALVLGGCGLVAVAGHPQFVPRVVFNTTASAPLGFYWLTPGRYAPGQLTAVSPPRDLALWLARRGYLPANVPLIKEVAAVEGQHVCRRADLLLIDGQVAGRVKAKDRWGRALPRFNECRKLGAGEVFLLNRRAPASLDSRYFGPLAAKQMLGRVTPIWVWNAGS